MLSGILLLMTTGSVLAGDDPSIKGQQRSDITSSMNLHISNNTISGKYVVYDTVVGELKRLKFKKLHAGIVKKGSFFVSCADFEDKNGKLYDMDFLVSPLDNGKYRVIQSLVHAIDGNKRKYHIEG